MSRSRRDRISAYEVDNLAPDHEFKQRKKKASKSASVESEADAPAANANVSVAAEPVEAPAPAPVATQPLPIAPTFQIQTARKVENKPKNRRESKFKGARALSKHFGLPIEFFLDEAEKPAPSLKREREAVVEEQVAVVPAVNAVGPEHEQMVEPQSLKKPKEDIAADVVAQPKQETAEPLRTIGVTQIQTSPFDEFDFAFEPNGIDQPSQLGLELDQYVLATAPVFPPVDTVVVQPPVLHPAQSFHDYMAEDSLAIAQALQNAANDFDASEDEEILIDENGDAFAVYKQSPQNKMYSNGSIVDLIDEQYPESASSIFPLHDAVRSGDINNVNTILDAQSDMKILLKTDYSGETALQLAARLGFTDIESLLTNMDRYVILDIIANTALVEAKNALELVTTASATKSKKGISKVGSDTAVDETVKLHKHCMFTRASKTKSKAKAAAVVEQDVGLQAVEEGLEKVARLQLAAKEELKSAMSMLQDAKEKQARRSTRKRK